MGLIGTRLLQTIENEIRSYQDADETLSKIAELEHTVNEEFVAELVQAAATEVAMAARLQELMAEEGIKQSAKVYGQVQKNVRKALFDPVTAVLAENVADVDSKTYVREDATLTLVTQKPKLVPHPDSTPSEAVAAHQRDVQLLIENEMYSSLQVMPDQHTMAWMQLRELNALPSLLSVVIEEQGYCKVKLHAKSI